MLYYESTEKTIICYSRSRNDICILQCAVRTWYGCHIRNCDTDESRSLAIALQEEVANRCMLLSPERVKVVNDTLKRQ